MNTNIIYLLISTFFIVQISSSNENIPRVSTPLGKIRGFYKVSHKNQLYEAYEGIPYALPPTESLRFKPPVPIEPWSNELDATEKPNMCMQYNSYFQNTTGSEDCLYLNVYAPRSKIAAPYPVIVFIHGGGFQSGYSIEHQPTHIIDKNVVFVTTNYRLGPFGFLSTGNELIPGNMGLKDQSVALRWISNNIKYFGGDPKKITLTGCSAGGSSVHYHYLSPMSVGLFQNGISSSSTALSTWAYTENPLEATMLLAKALKCPTESLTEIVRCFNQVPAVKMSDATGDILRSEFHYMSLSRPLYLPVAEKSEKDYFINRSPKTIIENNDVYDVPWIAGVASGEGIAFTSGFLYNQTRLSFVDKNWEKVGPYIMMFHNKVPKNKLAIMANLSRNHYLGNRSFEINDETAQGMINLVGDKIIGFDVQKTVKLQASITRNSVRFYYYDFYRVKSSKNYGVTHCDDWSFVLNNNDFDPSANPEATTMLESLLDFLYSFASGNDAKWRENWSKVEPETEYLNYMHIKGPNNTVFTRTDNFAERKFWNSFESQNY